MIEGINTNMGRPISPLIFILCPRNYSSIQTLTYLIVLKLKKELHHRRLMRYYEYELVHTNTKTQTAGAVTATTILVRYGSPLN